MAQYEKIKRPELLPKEWTIDSNEMTPKLSLKRKVIMANNKNLVDKIFALGNLLQQDNIILNLFALVKKEDSADNWDLVISSISFSKEEKEVIQDITLLLKKNLTNN